MTVTSLVRLRGRRVAVFVDGLDDEPALTLHAELAVEHDVRPGRELSAGDIARLAFAEACRASFRAGLRLLSYRQRSRREMRDRLARKGFDSAAVRDTIGRLSGLGYLDDEAFARSWSEARQAARPRSARVVQAELRARGIAGEIAEEATAGISDEEAAYEAATRRLRVFHGLEYRAFRERLGRFLTSRGFTYDVARRTIQRCWDELDESETAP